MSFRSFRVNKLVSPTDVGVMNHKSGILVLDDLMRNCSEDERTLDLFTKVSHRCDVTCIYLTQNLFPPGKFFKQYFPKCP